MWIFHLGSHCRGFACVIIIEVLKAENSTGEEFRVIRKSFLPLGKPNLTLSSACSDAYVDNPSAMDANKVEADWMENDFSRKSF